MSTPRTAARPTGRWLTRPRPVPNAALRLYCVPYAGAGATAYREWPAALADVPVEVVPVQLPGRENRLREDPFINVDVLAAEVLADVDRPYAVFGHSLGARLAFEVSRRLTAAGRPPEHLFVSGCPAPELPPVQNASGVRDSDLPDDEFLERVSGMGGTPAEVFSLPELRELLLPVIRADFKAVDDYVYEPGPPLPCPVTAFAGDADPEGMPAQMAGWERQAGGGFALEVLPGDHFFLHTRRTEVLGRIGADLLRRRAGSTQG